MDKGQRSTNGHNLTVTGSRGRTKHTNHIVIGTQRRQFNVLAADTSPGLLFSKLGHKSFAFDRTFIILA